MKAKDDEIERSETGQFDDPNRFIFTYCGEKGTPLQRIVSIPLRHQNFPLLQCMIRVLKELPTDKEKRVLKISSEIDSFIRFVDAAYFSPQSVPTSILQIYSQNLNIDNKFEPSSIRSKMTLLRFVIEELMARDWFQALSIDEREFILSVYAHRPRIPHNAMTDGKFPTMSELIINSPYDDLALLDSLVHFCLGFLNEAKRLREKLLQDEYVKEALELTFLDDETAVDWVSAASNTSLYDAVFNVIVKSKDEAFVERLLYSNIRYEHEFYCSLAPLDLPQLYLNLKKCVRTQGSLARKNVKATEPEEYITFERLDARSILSTCKTEEICLRWLLAADRIQQSGQEALLIDDLDISPTQITINYTKQKSEQPYRLSATHKKKTEHYKILDHHLNLRRSFAHKLPYYELNPDYFFQHENPFCRKQRIRSRTYGPIFFACHPGTHAYKKITDMYPGAKLFQKYYTELGIQNDRGKEDDDADQTRSLTANIIAQSRAIVDPEKPTPRTPYDRYARAKVEADATAHSEQVAQACYRIPSRANHRLSRRSDFVSAAGDLQEEDARKLATYMSRTSIMTLEEVDSILGWTVNYYTSLDLENFNKLVAQAEAHGYSCTPFGAFTADNGKERIIVKTAETAALIYSFIEGCEIELTSSSTKERDLSLILNIAYAKLVLKDFDQRTLSDGKKLHQDLNIPPAVI